jgi:hypothetical protein
MIGMTEIPSFQTLSRRARFLDMHAINSEFTGFYLSGSMAAVDSFMDTYI